MSWLTNLVKKATKVAAAAGAAYLTMQAKDGSTVNATPDAVGKAAELIGRARGGDPAARQKVEATADLAARGDPAAKQATTLLSVTNDYAKIQEAAAAQGKAAAEIYQPVDKSNAGIGAEFDVEQAFGAPRLDVPEQGAAYDWEWPDEDGGDGSGGEQPGAVEQG